MCTNPPPAPTIAQATYTASLQSNPQLQFTESGDADPITWAATDPSGLLSNLQFSEAQTTSTAGAASQNTLSMYVDPSKAAPGNYPINVTVTDSVSGLSATVVVTIQVVPPTISVETYNSEGIFEQDPSGNIIVSDGSDKVVVNGNEDPDFPLVSSTTTAATKRTIPKMHAAAVNPGGGLTNNGTFNPLSPPASIASDLNAFSLRNAGCYTVLNSSTAENDPTLGNSKNTGHYQVFAYCNAASTLPLTSFALQQTGYNLNTGAQSGQRSLQYLFGQSTSILGTYGPNGFYTVFSFPIIPASPISGIAERQEISYAFDIAFKMAPELGPITVSSGTENYYVNNRGVFYPKIKIPPKGAVGSVLLQSDGYVPFPSGPFYKCPDTGLYKCIRSTTFTDDLEAKLRGKPAGTRVAHHIQPISWCGTNDLDNGVFITDADHNQFTTWWKPEIAFTPEQNYDTSGVVCANYLKNSGGF